MKDSIFEGIPSKEISISEFLFKLGNFPRNSNKVVLCHGTFDIVHPGHLRQFAFAKTLGHTLVVSITSDKYVSKSGVKPYVPQEIRSINLSALGIIDYVLICDSETPDSLISQLRPDVYVKGFDYSDESNPKTQEERINVESYGGQMVYSPGDYVLSSTNLIESRNFNLGIEKLRILMKQEGVKKQDFINCLDEFRRISICVLGDTIVDQITYANAIGASGKTPTLSTKLINSEMFVGGAAIVAMHAAAAGANTNFVSVTGEDAESKYVANMLNKSHIDYNLFSEPSRPTTLKESIDVDGYRLLKIDRVSNAPISAVTSDRILDKLRKVQSDAYVFSDFRHGIFDAVNASRFLKGIPNGAVVSADSQVASRWGNITDFKGAELITVNEKEARYSLGNQDSPIRPLGDQLFKVMNPKLLVLKAGKDGVISYRRALEGSDPRHFFVLDSFARFVRDAVGAGDALLAYATIAWAISKNPLITTVIGLLAAGIECEHEGNVPVEHEILRGRVLDLGLS